MPRHVPTGPVGACQLDSLSILVHDGCVFGRKWEFDVFGFGDLLHFEEVGVVKGEFFHEVLLLGEIV